MTYVKNLMAILAAVAAMNAAAVELHVGALPDSAFIDTESSTNICFAAVSHGMSCDFLATVELEGTATDCYQLTFGADADGDGRLSPEESDISIGWRAGRWILGRTETAERFFAAPSQSAGLRTLSVSLHARSDGRLRGVKVFADGAALFPELAEGDSDWLFSRNWNIVEVVRRGDGPTSGWCKVLRDDRGFRMILR